VNLQEIIDYTRYQLGNYEKPYYWVDAELVMLTNKVINQMCVDGKLLSDDSSSLCDISTTANTPSYALNPLILSVNAARLVTQELMTIDTAPATAWAVGDTITGATSLKTCTIVSKLTDYTYTVDKRTGAFTLGEVLSNGTYTADQSTLCPRFTDYETTELNKTTNYDINEYIRTWRTDTAGEPTTYLLDNKTGHITLYPTPDQVYIVRLNVMRLPLVAMTTTLMSTQTPELNARYHNDIINGICAYAYLKHGEHTFNEKSAATFMALFKKAIADAKRENLMNGNNPGTQSPAGGFI
jgi:hypothetical protein